MSTTTRYVCLFAMFAAVLQLGCASNKKTTEPVSADMTAPEACTAPALELESLMWCPAESPSPYNDPNLNYWPGHNTEAYASTEENPFLAVSQNPMSTFSIDVDTASYSNVRRFLSQGMLPPADAVRIEEMINYFPYEYAPPRDKTIPFSSDITIAECPWEQRHQLARVAIKGWEMPKRERPAGNYVFLIDVSGSMDVSNKLPLVKEALRLLINQLNARDRIAIVVYAGASGLALPSTPGDQKSRIRAALDQLEAGGSTHGSAGIQQAYDEATQNYISDGVNRVILATDGDFNVGVTSEGELTRLIEEKAKSGVFLSVLGFGMGNLKDSTMEQLADKGNGNYAYIDTVHEARKVLVEQLVGTLVTIAKDVKIQVEFNPALVSAYRLIGYENRLLAAEDFNDDTKDAGEIGAGHAVTALYELVPAGESVNTPTVDPLKYQQPASPVPGSRTNELFTLKIRYKQPASDTSEKIEFVARNEKTPFEQANEDFRFATAVAGFGMLLRDSPTQGKLTYDAVHQMAEESVGMDKEGYRAEFLSLVERAKMFAAR